MPLCSSLRACICPLELVWLVQVYTVSKATAGLPQGSVWLLCSLIGAVLPELLHQTMSAEEMEVRETTQPNERQTHTLWLL